MLNNIIYRASPKPKWRHYRNLKCITGRDQLLHLTRAHTTEVCTASTSGHARGDGLCQSSPNVGREDKKPSSRAFVSMGLHEEPHTAAAQCSSLQDKRQMYELRSLVCGVTDWKEGQCHPSNLQDIILAWEKLDTEACLICTRSGSTEMKLCIWNSLQLM